MDIVVKGRNTEVTERFRGHVADKLGKIEKLDPKLISVDGPRTDVSDPGSSSWPSSRSRRSPWRPSAVSLTTGSCPQVRPTMRCMPTTRKTSSDCSDFRRRRFAR